MVMRLTTPPEAHSSLTTSTSTSSSQPFPFTFSPPNLSSGRPLHSPPSYRFPEECMNTFGARPMAEEWVPVVRRGLWKCDGSSHPGGSIAQGCGRILMEGAVQAHLGGSSVLFSFFILSSIIRYFCTPVTHSSRTTPFRYVFDILTFRISGLLSQPTAPKLPNSKPHSLPPLSQSRRRTSPL